MGKTIRLFNTTVFDKQESTKSYSLSRIIVLKSFLEIHDNTIEYLQLRKHIESLTDEPTVFIVKDKDKKSLMTAKTISPRVDVLSLNEIKNLNKYSITVLFVTDKYNSKIQKIIEIICNKVFYKSILVV